MGDGPAMVGRSPGRHFWGTESADPITVRRVWRKILVAFAIAARRWQTMSMATDSWGHPTAREVHRRLKEATEVSDESLLTILDSGEKSTYEEVLAFHTRVIKTIAEEVTVLAYMLDELTAQLANALEER